MRFKVGEKVRIKKWEELPEIADKIWSEAFFDFLGGETATIDKVNSFYFIYVIKFDRIKELGDNIISQLTVYDSDKEMLEKYIKLPKDLFEI